MREPAGRKPAAIVQEHLARMLASGEAAPGARLPTEREVAQELGVPRSAVRDALAALEGQKKVVRIIGSGTYAAKAPNADGTASWASNDVSPTKIMEARLLLEPRFAALAVANATAADILAMERCNARADLSDDVAAFEKTDADLHQAIAAATHNRLIVDAYGLVTCARDRTEWGELKKRSVTRERLAAYRTEHRDIVAAIRARDVLRAEQALVVHLEHVRRNLLGY